MMHSATMKGTKLSQACLSKKTPRPNMAVVPRRLSALNAALEVYTWAVVSTPQSRQIDLITEHIEHRLWRTWPNTLLSPLTVGTRGRSANRSAGGRSEIDREHLVDAQILVRSLRTSSGTLAFLLIEITQSPSSDSRPKSTVDRSYCRR